MKAHLATVARLALGLTAGLALALCGVCLLGGMLVIALTIRAHDWLESAA